MSMTSVLRMMRIKGDFRALITGLAVSVALLLAACMPRREDDYAARYHVLAAKNEDFGKAVDALESGLLTPDGRRQIARSLERALARSPMSTSDESIIKTLLASVYLPGIDAKGLADCQKAKQYSSSALVLDPKSVKALEIDVAADMCLAHASGSFDALIGRLESFRKAGKYYVGLYIALSGAYEERSERTNNYADLLKAREAWDLAKAMREPIVGSLAWERRAAELDEELRKRKP